MTENTENPKVAHILTRFLKGGTELNLIKSVEVLEAEGYFVDIIAGKDSDQDALSTLPVNKTYIVSELRREISLFLDFLALIKIYFLLKKNGYAIVHTHQSKAGIVGRIAAKLASVPVILHTVHMANFGASFGKLRSTIFIFLEKITAKITTVLVFVGEQLKEAYTEQNILSIETATVIRSPIALEKFENVSTWDQSKKIEKRKDLGCLSADKIIVVVASLELRKGHKYVLEISQQLYKLDKNIRVLLVGEGEQFDNIQQDILNKSLTNCVKLLGYRTDVAEIMKASDLILLTSLAEGLPQVLVQASVARVPIVTYPVEGAKEIVNNGVNGFIVPFDNISVAVEKIQDILYKRSIQNALDGATHDYKYWNESFTGSQLIDLYSNLLSSFGQLK